MLAECYCPICGADGADPVYLETCADCGEIVIGEVENAD